MRVRITDDVFFIASRLKEVDPTYYVVYDTEKRRYEVHSDGQRGNTLCFVVPFGRLDARTVEYARRTSNPYFGKAKGGWRRDRALREAVRADMKEDI